VCMNGTNTLTNNSTEYYLAMAERHKRSRRDNLVKQVRKVFKENPTIIRNKMSRLARQFYHRGREVMLEVHRLNAFIRFDVYPEYLLVSEVRPEHDVIDLMFNYFRRRYPDFILALYDQRQGYVSTRRPDICFPNLTQERNYWFFPRKVLGVSELRERLRPQLQELLDAENFTGEVWERYYDSQYIKERKNIKLARKALPAKMIKKAAGGLAYEARRLDEEEKDRQKSTLLDYI
jgi:probable DNA metabolism protein